MPSNAIEIYNCFQNFFYLQQNKNFICVYIYNIYIYILLFAFIYRLFDSILWTTEYKGIRTDHAELTDRSMYFHLTGTEMATTKQNP